MPPLLATIRSGMPSPFISASLTAPGASRPVASLAMTCVAVVFWLVVPYWTVTLLSDWSAKTKSGTPLPVRSATARAMACLDRLEGPEGAVAAALENQHIAFGVADQKVEQAVAADIGHGQSGGIGRRRRS